MLIAALVAASVSVAFAPASAGAVSTYYFHGTAADQANKLAGTPTATWNTSAPAGAVPVTQSTTGVANADFAGNPLGAFWSAPFTGTLSGGLQLDWWWTGNPEAQLIGLAMDVSVFADPDASGNGTQVGRSTVNINVGAQPKENVNVVPVAGTVTKTLLIQATAHFSDTGTGTQVYYDSTTTPSGFSFVNLPAAPAVSFDTTTQIAFAPGTAVSPSFLGGEPETTMERPTTGSQSGRIDPNRVFVDWPLSSRTQTSQVSRSTNGGDSFRMLLDLTACPERDRPNCLSGGGGDSKTDVNLYDGNLFFADQEVLANEALASSTDHGDTWPAARQHAISNGTTGVDRQWLAYIDPNVANVAGDAIDGFLSYHIPIAGEYIQGIDVNGVPIPQPAPQITGVSQSGTLRVDNSSGPAHGWIYQTYRGGGGVMVATAYAPGWQTPGSWQSNVVSGDNALIFPWLDIDSSGNAFMVWVNDKGVLNMSESPIQDARNNPKQGGRPGTYWTHQAELNPPGVGSTIFPEVRAGDLGRIAIAFMGSTDCKGQSDNCADTTHWNTYIEFLPDALALSRGTTLTVQTGIVSHRIDHRGNICTSGTTCTTTGKDRSLLDMLDLGFDSTGRVGVVYMDNNNRLAAPNLTDAAKNGPFTMFAKETLGPSLLAGQSSFNISIPQNSRTSAAGDATWPNTAAGTNLASLDLLGASLGLTPDGTQVMAKVPINDATLTGMARDLNAYNSSTPTLPGARVQFVVRWTSGDDVWHMDMDYTPSTGAVRYFGGSLSTSDGVTNGTGTIVGARYTAKSGFTVSGGLTNGVLTLVAPAPQFGLTSGTAVQSVSAFSMAGPSESDTTATTIANSMRTVDATPPFDGNVTAQQATVTSIDCTDKSISESGGWHVLSEPGAGNGTLCRVVGGGGNAWMSVPFNGSGIDVVTATGPRGGDFNVSIDGAFKQKISDYRPPTDPAHPDMTGRNDLTFGVTYHFDVSSGPHTLRIDVLDDTGVGTQNMDYVDGFNIYSGFTTGTGGSPQAVSQLVSALLGPLVDTSQTILATATTIDIDAIVQAVPGVTVTITDPTGKVVAQGIVQNGVVALRFPTNGQLGAFVVDVHNPTAAGQPVDLWEVVEGK